MNLSVCMARELSKRGLPSPPKFLLKSCPGTLTEVPSNFVLTCCFSINSWSQKMVSNVSGRHSAIFMSQRMKLVSLCG